jgi:hypothetical protein
MIRVGPTVAGKTAGVFELYGTIIFTFNTTL